jgi:hypothetical protein
MCTLAPGMNLKPSRPCSRSAFAQLAELADQGHPQATRLALQMWRYGPSLYGQRFELGDGRRTRWLASARPALIADSSR